MARERQPEAEAPAAPADPAPWQEARRAPSERPRHERAVPEDEAAPAETTAAIAAESWGEVIERAAGDTVDGDFNGAPELAALEDTERWEGADALDAMRGAEAETLRENASAEEVLADAVAERREVLEGRLEEARELGLGEVVEAAVAETEPAAGAQPVVPDADELRDQLERVDAAIEALERRSAGAPEPAAASERADGAAEPRGRGGRDTRR